MTPQLAPAPARPLLDWMQSHPERLRTLLAEEAAGAEDVAPVSDAAIRAHLRFVAEALAGHAEGGQRGELRAFARRLDDEDIDLDRIEDAIELVGAATAHELRLQFGASAAQDEALGTMAARRVRIAAWHRVFVDELAEALGADTLDAAATHAWMSANQAVLADTIFAMDRRAKQYEIALGGPDAVASSAVANRIGQAATLHAHTRFLVDALARNMRAAA